MYVDLTDIRKSIPLKFSKRNLHLQEIVRIQWFHVVEIFPGSNDINFQIEVDSSVPLCFKEVLRSQLETNDAAGWKMRESG